MSLIRNYNQKRFVDVWPSYDDMAADLTTFSFFKPDIPDDNIKIAYYLILSRYGDTPIAGYKDETRWKIKFFSVLYSYGVEWYQKTLIQQEIASMTTAELQEGSKSIFNTALNPNSAPSDASLEELEYINSQNTENRKRSKADALTLKWQLLSSDLNDWLIDRFRNLFSRFIATDVPVYAYPEDDEDE